MIEELLVAVIIHGHAHGADVDANVSLDHSHGLGVDVGMAEAATKIGFLGTAFLVIFLAGEQAETEVQ